MSVQENLELTPEMERELIAMAKNHIRRRHSTDPEVRANAQGRTQQLINEAFNLLH